MRENYRLNKDIFVTRANIIHNNKYDYSKSEYVTAKTKLCIICPIHGEFYQTPDKHLRGSGCRKCKMSQVNESRKISTEEFIKRSKERYGDKFSYDKCNVNKMHEKVTLTCKLHGDFEITPASHLRNEGGCKECLNIKNHNKYASNDNEFIKRAKEVHGDKYDYSKVKYINNRTKVCIICPKHGEFWQTPYKHINRRDICRKCSYENIAEANKFTTADFIKRAKEVHGNKYDYSKVIYKGYDDNICIICPIHGEFYQTPDSHLQGSGCQKCSFTISKSETELSEYLRGFLEVEIRNRTILGKKELDIYIPSRKIAIEYNGLRWHSEEFGKDKWYHLNKLNKCNQQNIKLIQIFEDEYENNKNIVLNKVKHILNIETNLSKIMGRKCKISVIDNKIAKQFLNTYHIQGFASSTVYLGAFYNDLLVAVMTFKQENKKSLKWELNRFASNYNYICQGVGGKLFNYFIKNYNPNEIKSFADRRWTLDINNNLYTKLGFKLDKVLDPEYRYYNNKVAKYTRFHKFKFRKHKLHKKYGLPLTMTETEMTKALGYSRIWDCGLIKYVWKK